MQPSNSTVTIDGDKFNALAAHVEISTHHDDRGMPLMGSLKCGISFLVDMHDNQNMTCSKLSKLYELAKMVTRDKIKDIKIEYWTDDSQAYALIPFAVGSVFSVRAVVRDPITYSRSICNLHWIRSSLSTCRWATESRPMLVSIRSYSLWQDVNTKARASVVAQSRLT